LSAQHSTEHGVWIVQLPRVYFVKGRLILERVHQIWRLNRSWIWRKRRNGSGANVAR
jgi:hypothetical protein